jgi:uncharacterized membrane protein
MSPHKAEEAKMMNIYIAFCIGFGIGALLGTKVGYQEGFLKAIDYFGIELQRR